MRRNGKEQTDLGEKYRTLLGIFATNRPLFTGTAHQDRPAGRKTFRKIFGDERKITRRP